MAGPGRRTLSQEPRETGRKPHLFYFAECSVTMILGEVTLIPLLSRSSAHMVYVPSYRMEDHANGLAQLSAGSETDVVTVIRPPPS